MCRFNFRKIVKQKKTKDEKHLRDTLNLITQLFRKTKSYNSKLINSKREKLKNYGQKHCF